MYLCKSLVGPAAQMASNFFSDLQALAANMEINGKRNSQTSRSHVHLFLDGHSQVIRCNGYWNYSASSCRPGSKWDFLFSSCELCTWNLNFKILDSCSISLCTQRSKAIGSNGTSDFINRANSWLTGQILFNRVYAISQQSCLWNIICGSVDIAGRLAYIACYDIEVVAAQYFYQ